MLRTNPLFYSYVEQLYLAQAEKPYIRLKHFEKDHFLIEQGELPSQVLLIKSGITKCYIFEDNGKEFIFEFLSKGEIVGEIEAIKGTANLCNIKSLTLVEAYAMTVNNFKELVAKNDHFNRMLIETFAERLIQTSSRASFQQSYTIEFSVSRLLQLLSDQGIQLSKDDIASYLGINIRSLNRALKKLGFKIL